MHVDNVENVSSVVSEGSLNQASVDSNFAVQNDLDASIDLLPVKLNRAVRLVQHLIETIAFVMKFEFVLVHVDAGGENYHFISFSQYKLTVKIPLIFHKCHDKLLEYIMASLLLEVGPTQAEEAVTALLPVCLTGFPFCFSPDVVQHVTKGATTTTMTIRSD